MSRFGLLIFLHDPRVGPSSFCPVSSRSSNFTSNNAVGSGGVLSAFSGSTILTVDGCSFSRNNGGDEGGVINVSGTSNIPSLLLSNSLFEENTAVRGGAIAVKETTSSLTALTLS
jgi:predicted outer membrane repeat protein